MGNDSFAKDPPNATISVLSNDGATVKDAVVVLKAPKLEGDSLTFEVSVLEGDLTNATGAAALFINWPEALTASYRAYPNVLSVPADVFSEIAETWNRLATKSPIRRCSSRFLTWSFASLMMRCLTLSNFGWENTLGNESQKRLSNASAE